MGIDGGLRQETRVGKVFREGGMGLLLAFIGTFANFCTLDFI